MPYARRATLRGGANALHQRPTDRGQPALGGRPGDGPLRGGRRPVRGRRTRSPTRMRAEADAIVFEATTDHGRLAGFGLDGPARPRRPAGPDPDPLQHRAARLRPVRDRARASSRRRTTPAATVHVWVDETRPYLQGARLTAWELAQAGVPHTLLPDVAAGHLMATRRGGRRPRRRRPGRGQRRHRQQGRDLPAGRPGRPPRRSRSTSARRPARSTSRRPTARPSRSRSAAPDEVLVVPRRPHRAARHRGPQPGLRRHAGRAHHRDRHRGGRRPRAVRRRASRAATEAARARWAAMPGFTRRAGRVRRADTADRAAVGRPADGDRRASGGAARSSRGRRPTRRSCARSSSATGCSRPTPSATSRSASSRRTRWGVAWDGDAPIALVLEYNGPTPAAAVRRWAARTASRSSCATSSGRGSPTSRRRPRSCPRSRPPTAWTRARRWSGCGSTGPRFRPYPADRPAPAAGRDRRAQPALPARLRLVAAVDARSPTASTTGCASTASWSRPRGRTSSARRPGWPSSATS